MTTYAEIDNSLEPLTPKEKELQEYFGVPLIDGKRILSTVGWWTGRYGLVAPEKYAPVTKMTSDHLMAELREYWLRNAPRNSLKGDPYKAIQIAHILFDYYENLIDPEVWMGKARDEVRRNRAGSPEFLWKPDPFSGRQLVYGRERPGW